MESPGDTPEGPKGRSFKGRLFPDAQPEPCTYQLQRPAAGVSPHSCPRQCSLLNPLRAHQRPAATARGTKGRAPVTTQLSRERLGGAAGTPGGGSRAAVLCRRAPWCSSPCGRGTGTGEPLATLSTTPVGPNHSPEPEPPRPFLSFNAFHRLASVAFPGHLVWMGRTEGPLSNYRRKLRPWEAADVGKSAVQCWPLTSE